MSLIIGRVTRFVAWAALALCTLVFVGSFITFLFVAGMAMLVGTRPAEVEMFVQSLFGAMLLSLATAIVAGIALGIAEFLTCWVPDVRAFGYEEVE